MSNIFAVYKPKGKTSHDIIDEIRKVTGVKKVGHAGTLDPLARGVLVVGVGREATKGLAKEVAKEKEYVAKIQLGKISTTDDAEGEKRQMTVWTGRDLSMDNVTTAVQGFVGEIMQIPPIYSALKIRGKPAYTYARSGKNIQLKSRKVLIKTIDVLEYQWPYLVLRVICGKGVYIRALARDIGQSLGVGGYLADLERTRVGEYTKEDVVNVAYIKNIL